MAAPVLQFKRGLLDNLPGLRAGEPGFTTDSYDLYVGIDSTTANNQFVGSGRYWTINSATTGSGVNLVEGTDNGTAFVTLKAPDDLSSGSGIVTFTMPGSDGNSGDILTTNGSGTLSFSAPASSTLTVAADTGTNDDVTVGTDTLTFTGGEGIETTVSDNKITIDGEAASSTNAGIASYQSAQFYFEDTYKVGVVTATSSVKGIASFDSTDFTVTSGDVALNAERIQDIVGAAITTGTQTLITVTYDDANGEYDFVVDNDLANYSNTTSAFITASSTDTLTNKTFNANGTGNSISNLEVADFATSGITTSGDTLASNDSDTQLPTSAAVIDYVDAQDANIASDTLTFTNKTFDANGTGNSISNLEVDDFAAAAIVTEGEGVSSSDNDTSIPTTAAVIDHVSTEIGNIDLETGLSNGAGSTSTISTSGTLVIEGTTSEVEVGLAGTVFTIGLPNNVSVSSELTAGSAIISDLNSGRVVLAGTSGALEDSANLTFDGTTLTVTGDAAIDNVTINGNTVSTSSGGLTLDSTSGTTTVADDLTVNGTLTVLGTQSIINTETLKVEDSLVEVGLVNSGGSLVAPSSDADIDVGLVMHYYSGSAKTAALFWDDSVGRVVAASEVTESSSVMGSITYANFEIGGLFVNGCTGAASQVITCSDSTIILENITVDGGSF